ncbi:MAG: hypothetical protein ABI977_17295 [Acidobacteriota bacterium]
MTITIDLPDELHQRLEKHAQLRGATVSEAITQLLEEVEANRRSAFFERLRAEGFFLPKDPLPPDYQRVYKRIDVQGKPVSECLVEERR